MAAPVEPPLADRPPAARRPAPVPWVAMYHSVGDCSDDPYRITVTPDRLEHQLTWLRRRGLRGVSVAELLDARAVEAVRKAGYRYACAIDPGPLTGPHALPRAHVGQNDTAWRLQLKLRLHRWRRRPVEGV